MKKVLGYNPLPFYTLLSLFLYVSLVTSYSEDAVQANHRRVAEQDFLTTVPSAVILRPIPSGVNAPLPDNTGFHLVVDANQNRIGNLAISCPSANTLNFDYALERGFPTNWNLEATQLWLGSTSEIPPSNPGCDPFIHPSTPPFTDSFSNIDVTPFLDANNCLNVATHADVSRDVGQLADLSLIGQSPPGCCHPFQVSSQRSPTDQSYFRITLDGQADLEGWCLDALNPIRMDTRLCGQLISSFDPALQTAGIIGQPQNLDLANYVINNEARFLALSDETGAACTWQSVQRALWRLIDVDRSLDGSSEFCIQQIVLDAQANGRGFTPGCPGGKFLMLIVPTSPLPSAVRMPVPLPTATPVVVTLPLATPVQIPVPVVSVETPAPVVVIETAAPIVVIETAAPVPVVVIAAPLPVLTPAPTFPFFIPTPATTFLPSFIPTFVPGTVPTFVASTVPTFIPSSVPVLEVSTFPTLVPSIQPTFVPSTVPTSVVVTLPTTIPSTQQVFVPSTVPTSVASTLPTTIPSTQQVFVPSTVPTLVPSTFITTVPSLQPVTIPSTVQTMVPSTFITTVPSLQPINVPSTVSSFQPSTFPTTVPSTVSVLVPSSVPTLIPSSLPTLIASTTVTFVPSLAPTLIPSLVATLIPSLLPTPIVTLLPSFIQTTVESASPTFFATTIPTFVPSFIPTTVPSLLPAPTPIPTPVPTPVPTVVVVPQATAIFIPTPFPTPKVQGVVVEAGIATTLDRSKQHGGSSAGIGVHWTRQAEGVIDEGLGRRQEMAAPCIRQPIQVVAVALTLTSANCQRFRQFNSAWGIPVGQSGTPIPPQATCPNINGTAAPSPSAAPTVPTPVPITSTGGRRQVPSTEFGSGFFAGATTTQPVFFRLCLPSQCLPGAIAPTASAAPAPTVSVIPTATPAVLPTASPVAIAIPTATPAPILPTLAPILPTATPIVLPTATPVIVLPTATPIIVLPTATPIVVLPTESPIFILPTATPVVVFPPPPVVTSAPVPSVPIPFTPTTDEDTDDDFDVVGTIGDDTAGTISTPIGGVSGTISDSGLGIDVNIGRR